MSNYIPYTVAWEITMGCNMRCKHCGSACKEKLEGELSTEQALVVCDQLASAGTEYITLTGGEPTIRRDWPILAKKIKDLGMTPNVVSNGWLVDAGTAKAAFDAGILNFAISLDGLKETHDYMRTPGSFDRVMDAIDNLKAAGVRCSVITCINQKNIRELDGLLKILREKNLDAWQLQYALPMGSFHSRKDSLMILPNQVDEVIDFAYRNRDCGIMMYLGDCVGYYSQKEFEVKSAYYGETDALWSGCAAGKYAVGILHNGDVIGCTSFRNQEYIEGNLMEKPLAEIWKQGFAWTRDISRSNLDGFCKECLYGEICLGGCSNERYCLNGSVNSENPYCSYSIAVKNSVAELLEGGIEKRNLDDLLSRGQLNVVKCLIDSGEIERDIDVQNMQHYVLYKMGLVDEALAVIQAVLQLDPSDSYALYGKCVCLASNGLYHDLDAALDQYALHNTIGNDMRSDLIASLQARGDSEKVDALSEKLSQF